MRIGVLGAAGRIGACVCGLLADAGHKVVGVDAGEAWEPALQCEAVMNCMPADQAVTALNASKGRHYVDLCESLVTARRAARLAPSGGTYVPNSGLAPGAVSLIAAHLITSIDADECVIYCGALPADRSVGYRISWSVDGLLGIYQGWCFELEAKPLGGQVVCHPALTGYELVEINGEQFEAFSTAGGSGTLPQTYRGKVQNLQYKTLRYPGHLEQVRRLLAEPDPREAFLAAFSGPVEDRVVLSVRARGAGAGDETCYERDIRPSNGWSAIQRATAGGAIGALMATRGMPGYVRQEDIPFELWREFQCGVFF